MKPENEMNKSARTDVKKIVGEKLEAEIKTDAENDRPRDVKIPEDLKKEEGEYCSWPKKTILIAEDSYVNRKILVKLLSEDYHILEAENGREALALLHRHGKGGNGVSGIILDLIMPVMDGFAFLKEIRGIKEYENIPVIVATAKEGSESEASVLRLGAWDFITKPYNGEVIKFRLRNAIERSQLSAFSRLKYLAEYDTLTGIYNKNKFFLCVKEMLESNPAENYAFVRLDIDRFQLVNSFFGMEEGDGLLRHLAAGLKKYHDRELFSYGRIEADVFAICFQYTHKEEVIAKLEESREYVKSYNPNFDIVAVFGVYFLDDLSLPVSEMLDRATLAAKTCKGNYVQTVAVYKPAMSKNLQREQEIINEMGAALEQKQFCVYFQPKYSLETATPQGGEALVRWNHPVKGMIPPSEFIPVFEKNGFIAKLDYYVWESVCERLHGWITKGYEPAPVSVNISRVNLYNPQTPKLIEALVRRYDIPPQLLQLELTESVYMDNPQIMEQFTEQLHSKGFSILMDDFGSGYSSLSILKDIEVDILKIDMRFFENAKTSGRGENVVSSVIRMAKWLKIPTIAEGVEKEEQVSFLKSIGCDYVQGYYFARPMPADAYERLISDHLSVSVKFKPRCMDNFDVDRLWSSNPEIEIFFSEATQANAIFEFDGNFPEILRINKQFNEKFGYIHEFKHFDTLEFVHEEDKEKLIAAFRLCAETRETESCEYRRKDKNNQMLWVKIYLQYICPVGNKHIVLGHLVDITSEKILSLEVENYKRNKDESASRDFPDEKIFQCNRVYNIKSLRLLLNFLAPVFDVVRIVNPIDTSVITLTEDGKIKSAPYSCFKIWKKDTRCENCSSICSMRAECRMTKYEFIKNNVFYVVSNPVTVEDDEGERHQFALEIVSRVSDQLMLRNCGEKTVGQLIEETQRKIYTDELTGCFNRRYFREMLFAHHSQMGVVEQMAIVMLDLRNFKKINDFNGHAVGDRVLLRVAQALREIVRESDSVIRYGGDEFIAVLVNYPEVEVKQMIERMREEICKLHYDGKAEDTVGADFGYAYVEKFDFKQETLKKMLFIADEAMYEEKGRKIAEPKA